MILVTTLMQISALPALYKPVLYVLFFISIGVMACRPIRFFALDELACAANLMSYKWMLFLQLRYPC